MDPDQQALIRDLRSTTFRLGEHRSKWKLLGLSFPYLLFFVSAPPRPVGPPGFLLRSECKGYSATPPTSQLWDGSRNLPLAEPLRPKNQQGGVMEPFKSWGNCLYHPIDRLARDHNNWVTLHPDKIWTPQRKIAFLLETVYDLLHCSEYSGAVLSEETLEVPKDYVELDLGPPT